MSGIISNANAYNASRWDWVGDPSVTLRTLQGRASYIGRITAQVSARHRITYNQEYQRRCEGSTLRIDSDNGCNTRGKDWVAVGAGNATLSPEANVLYFGNLPYHVNQVVWNAPMTSKLLLEAGFTRFMFRGGGTGRPAPDGITDLIQVTEQSTAINPATGLQYAPRANYVYRGTATWNPNYANPNNWRASATYVTGSHELKAGYQGSSSASRTGTSLTSRSWPTGSTRACRTSSRSGCRSGISPTARQQDRCTSRTSGRAAG